MTRTITAQRPEDLKAGQRIRFERQGIIRELVVRGVVRPRGERFLSVIAEPEGAPTLLLIGSEVEILEEAPLPPEPTRVGTVYRVNGGRGVWVRTDDTDGYPWIRITNRFNGALWASWEDLRALGAGTTYPSMLPATYDEENN